MTKCRKQATEMKKKLKPAMRGIQQTVWIVRCLPMEVKVNRSDGRRFRPVLVKWLDRLSLIPHTHKRSQIRIADPPVNSKVGNNLLSSGSLPSLILCGGKPLQVSGLWLPVPSDIAIVWYALFNCSILHSFRYGLNKRNGQDCGKEKIDAFVAREFRL